MIRLPSREAKPEVPILASAGRNEADLDRTSRLRSRVEPEFAPRAGRILEPEVDGRAVGR